MIPAKRPPAQPARWQQLWREAMTDPRELLQLLDLSHLADELLAHADTGFAMRVPR
jgi:L-lysine 2,3-aminomutase